MRRGGTDYRGVQCAVAALIIAAYCAPWRHRLSRRTVRRGGTDYRGVLCAVAALIIAAYCAPWRHRLSRRTVRRGGTDYRGVLCAALIPLCAPHFDAIPESALSCKAPQFLDCGAFPRIATLLL